MEPAPGVIVMMPVPFGALSAPTDSKVPDAEPMIFNSPLLSVRPFNRPPRRLLTLVPELSRTSEAVLLMV